MDTLTLRPTTAQLRNLVLATFASAALAGLLLHEHLAVEDPSDRILGWGIAFAAAMLVMAAVTIAYSRAFTECTDAGIRVRGLGLERRWRWDQVSGVSVRIGSRGITRTVMLTLADRQQVLLGAPVTGGLMPDRDFDSKADEIQQFWRRVRGRDSYGWIPLGTVLVFVAACLAVAALWVTSRVRKRRARLELQPWRDPSTAAPAVAAGGPQRPFTARTAVTAGAACLAVAGTAAAVLFLPLPSLPVPAAARACADFDEWVAAQPGTGVRWTDLAALTRAARAAPGGALGNDLYGLTADVKAAAQLRQSLAGADAQVGVMTDMQAVGHDCYG